MPSLIAFHGRAPTAAGGFRLLLAVSLLAVSGPLAAHQPGAREVVSEVGGTRWTAGNRVRLLGRPEEAWQARLELIGRARHHIFLSTYSWHNDRYGREFAERLRQVAVERRRDDPDFVVYCLVDATAAGAFSWWSYSFRDLRAAGVELRAFNPSSGSATAIYDGRLHDKMVIVDGRWAIVGGRNLAEEYFDPRSWWLDLGVEVEGEAVHDLQLDFLKAWAVAADLAKPVRLLQPEETLRRRVRTLFDTGHFPKGRRPLAPYLNEGFFPEPEVGPGGVDAAVLYDNSLAWRRARSTDVTVGLIGLATAEIDMMTPFPNLVEEMTAALEAAISRGVRVRLFVNGDEAAIRRGPFWLAGLPTLIRIIEAGGEVWAWSGDGPLRRELDEVGCEPATLPPVALHGKALRIDDRLTLVTSSNFNVRSTFYNSEAGLVVLDPELNSRLLRLVDDLVSLHDLEVGCQGGLQGITVERIVRRLTADDIQRMRRALRGKQGFVESMAVLW